MSILKLKPSCKDYVWGGHRLAEKKITGRNWLKHGNCPAIRMDLPTYQTENMRGEPCRNILTEREKKFWEQTAEDLGSFPF